MLRGDDASGEASRPELGALAPQVSASENRSDPFPRASWKRRVPAQLMFNIGVEDDENIPQIDLTAERHQVQQSARKNLYTGKTYNSLDNISQFFGERGMNFPYRCARRLRTGEARLRPHVPNRPSRKRHPAGLRSLRASILRSAPRSSTAPGSRCPRHPLRQSPGSRQGTVVEHPKYGTGTVIRREGDGPDAKLTVLFPGHGLKKLVERYAGLKKT